MSSCIRGRAGSQGARLGRGDMSTGRPWETLLYPHQREVALIPDFHISPAGIQRQLLKAQRLRKFQQDNPRAKQCTVAQSSRKVQRSPGDTKACQQRLKCPRQTHSALSLSGQEVAHLQTKAEHRALPGSSNHLQRGIEINLQ